MWLGILVPIGFVGIVIFAFMSAINLTNNKKKSKTVKRVSITLGILIVTILIVFQVGGLRMDTAGGQHIIIPTAIDTDFWGNYKVYYKTTLYESNQSEGHYMIEKEREDLAQQIREYMRERKQILVHYDRYVGFKGMSSPNESPIIKIEEMDSDTYYNY